MPDNDVGNRQILSETKIDPAGQDCVEYRGALFGAAELCREKGTTALFFRFQQVSQIGERIESRPLATVITRSGVVMRMLVTGMFVVMTI